MRSLRPAVRATLLTLALAAPAAGQTAIEYRIGFEEAPHHRLQVTATFSDIQAATLEVVMSRTSPGRYAIHEFAKNVYDVRIDDGRGNALPAEQPSPSEWYISGHAGTVRVRYKVFGDLLDGTFLSVDATHAHMNMPAVLMWARGLEARPARVTFDLPPQWKVATQLYPSSDRATFTAPNLAYLIDSPAEASAFTQRTFAVDREFRVALHHRGSESDADQFAAGLERIVREARAVFGEFPPYETPYTFIADYLPWATDDAMEHRNSTLLTSSSRLGVPDERLDVLGTAAHEFFHGWNIERIRPRSLEPFTLDQPNPSGELWFGEGFTQYYQQLLMRRSGLWTVDRFADRIGYMLDVVTRTPARQYRSVEDMSRFAQFVDQAAWSDPTNFDNTFVSYYDWGAMVAMGLDLSLRTRTGNAVTLDHYMRRLWRDFGSGQPSVPGGVMRPYTVEDLRNALAEVSGDSAFARQFFDRYIHGREIPDYASLLERAGFVIVKAAPGRPWVGPIALDFAGGSVRISRPTLEGSPGYIGGLDLGDELLLLDGATIAGVDRWHELINQKRPGDRTRVSIRRRGTVQDLTVVVAEDPRMKVVPLEATGKPPTAAQRAFRDAWIASKQ